MNMKKFLLIIASFVILTNYLFAQPANDNCAGAIVLTPGASCSYVAGTTTGATQSFTGCAGTADDDVWYRFTATATSHTVQVQSGASFDAVFQVYSGSCGGTSLVCRDATGSGGLESYNLTGLTVGSTYWIRVYHYFSGAGSGNFQICVTAPPSAPTNDDPCSATPLTVGSSCSFSTYTNASATASAGVPAPGCASYSGGDVWFSVTVPASGRIIIDSNTGVITDGGMAIYSGTCGSLTLIECDDDDSPNGNMPMIDRSGLTPGSTIWIRFWEYGNDNNGTFNICVYDPCSGVSSCSSLLGTGVINVASLPYASGAGTNCGAGDDITSTNAVTCGSTRYFGGEDQVFVFTPTSSGCITIDLTSSGSWTGLMLYQGCPAGGCGVTPGTCIANAQSSTGSKSMTVTVTAGQTYYLVLDSWPSPTCNAYSNLTISAPSPAPANDAACSAIALTLGVGTSGNNTCSGATGEPVSPTCWTTGTMNTVWYSFVAPASGSVNLNFAPGTLANAQMEVFSGTCAALTSIYCTANNTGCLTGLTPGNTYFFRIDGDNDLQGTFTITASDGGAFSCITALGTGVINVAALPYASGAGTTCGAGDDITSANAATCGSTSYFGGEDQVFVFTPTSSGCITIDLTSSGSWTGLMLYQGCPVGPCGPGSGICVANAQSSTGSKSLTATVTAGQTYYLVLDVFPSPTCNAYSNLTISAPSPGPYNDDICNAQALILGTPYYGTNVCAGSTGEPTAPGCWTTGTMNTVWYSAVAPASGQLKVRTLLGTLTETQIQVFSSSTNTCTGVLTSIGCNQSFTACGNTQNSSELVLTGLTPGNTYFIRVDGRNDLQGSFSIVAIDGTQPYPPVFGQDCAAPLTVCNSTMNMGDPGFIGFGLNCDIPTGTGCPGSCLTSGEKNIVYYQFDVNGGNLLFTINPNLSSTDYDWALFDVTGVASYCTQMANGTLLPIRCSYAAPSGATGLDLTSTDQCEGSGGDRFVQYVSVTGNRTYILAISNFSGNNTGYSLDFAGTPNLVLDASTYIWSGYSGVDPTIAANWSGCGVPNCGIDVEVFGGPANQPVLATGQVLNVRNITINPGAGITIQANADLLICGDFQNYGTLTNFNALSETRFVGTAALQTISGNLTGVYSLGNVRIQKSGPGTVRLTDNMECIGEFRIDNSTNNTFNCNGRTLTLRNHFTNAGTNGTFLHGNGTVEFTGTSTQNYTDPGGDLLYNVEVNKSNGNVVLTTTTPTMNIANQLDLTQGHITTDHSQHVFMQNTSLTSIINYNANSYINGRLRRNISASGGAYVFPVGSTTGAARSGYHPFTLNFTSTTATSMVGSYIPAASSYSSGSLNECGNLFTCTYNNLGYWRVVDTNATFAGTYNFDATANTPASPTCSGTITVNTVAKAPTTSSAWALEGTTCTNGYYRNNLTSFSDFVIIGSDTPLPVEGMLLTAIPTQNQILLNWDTQLEINNKGFYVQRSLDAQTFEVIGWVNGAGNSQTPLNYQFIDNQVIKNQRYYYRLEQLDYNGSTKFSNVAEAMLGDFNESMAISIYPNPTNGSAFVSLYLKENSTVQVKLFNTLGQNVLNLEQNLNVGQQKLEIPTKDLANGIYDLQVNIDGKTQNFKLSIVK